MSSEKHYTASLSRSQGRPGFSIIFRHPCRGDDTSRKGGLRVRQGLRTTDEAEAEQLKIQINELLSDSKYWDIAARTEAEKRFDPRVVDIFYHKMSPGEVDFAEVRESFIPLPAKEEDYRRVLLLGTTGAGKTTLLRQLIGTDPEKERFPSTSTAKTTVHDTEVVLDAGPYRAVVTFFPIDEVREHLNECISAAVLAAYRKEQDSEVLRKLLAHVNQRFRFNYVLGNGPSIGKTDFEDDEDEEDSEEAFHDDATAVVDLEVTNAVLASAIKEIRDVAEQHGTSLRDELGALDEKDQCVIDELFEEELDSRLRKDDSFHKIADSLLDEIEKRFDLFTVGTVQRTKQSWPESWSWEIEDREAFIRAVSRFSSNSAKSFGYLLTPLVSGVRVAGPFQPEWNSTKPKLVLMDGEGLGHTPKSSATISTSLSRRIDAADAVLLVDNATQPMQAAAFAAMRELVSTGNAAKLLIAFTHFDAVKGDNLPTAAEKARHVLASAENVLAAMGEELGPFAERVLRQRLEKGRFFLGGIDQVLSAEKKTDKRTITQLQNMLEAIDNIVERPKPVPTRPIYDRLYIVLAVKKAAENFHETWWPRLGMTVKPGVPKEHWTRVKALTRRLATPGWPDEYDTLKPVADLRQLLQTRVYVLLQNPVSWTAGEPTDDEKQLIFDKLAENLSRRLLDLSAQRIRAARIGEWQKAYEQRDRGSSYRRATIIAEEIYDRAAPIPDVAPSPDKNSFLHQVAAEVDAAAAEMGAKLV